MRSAGSAPQASSRYFFLSAGDDGPRDLSAAYLAPEILRHRLLLTYDALARDITTDHVVQRILASVPATWVSPKPNDAFGAGAPKV